MGERSLCISVVVEMAGLPQQIGGSSCSDQTSLSWLAAIGWEGVMAEAANQMGLDLDDDASVFGSAAFVERDQFVYFVTLARELGDPADWPGFRDELVTALNAAWGLDTIWSDLPAEVQRERTATRLQRAHEILDEVRQHHDPLCDWDRFVDVLWDSRSRLRA